MKTRFAYITLSAIAALVLSSCDKTELTDRKKIEDPNLTINIGVSSQFVTKTAGNSTDAEEYEKAINTARIFLAKANENGEPDTTAPVVEVDQKLMKMTDIDGGKHIEAKVFGIKGNYQLLYVAVNCPSDFEVDKTSYTKFIGSYTSVTKSILNEFWKVEYASAPDPVTGEYPIENGSFFMVNGTDSNNSTKDHNGGVFVDFSSTVSATVNLERIAAKIVADQDKYIDFSAKRKKVFGDTDATSYIVSAAVIDSWALMNCVNSFNLIQSYATESKYSQKVVSTPSSSNDYPVATLPNNLSSAGYYFTNPAVSGKDAQGIPTYSELEFVKAGSALYCLENNPDYYVHGYVKTSTGNPGVPSVSDSKMMGRCTAVIFRAQLRLADGFDADATIDDPIGNDPDGPDDWDVTPPTKANTNIVATIYSYKSKMYASLTRLKSDYGELASCSDDTALREKGVKIYENGYMYYTYYISKSDFAGSSVAPYYCVERNKSYRLTVTNVTSFGDELPCDYSNYDPEDPIDRATPRIKVSVEVLPWTIVPEQTYEIQ